MYELQICYFNLLSMNLYARTQYLYDFSSPENVFSSGIRAMMKDRKFHVHKNSGLRTSSNFFENVQNILKFIKNWFLEFRNKQLRYYKNHIAGKKKKLYKKSYMKIHRGCVRSK